MSAKDRMLEMRGVAKSYPSTKGKLCVLRGVDLAIHAGEFTAVTGPSGSGKTTFLNLAALLDTPTAGEVFFDDKLVSSLPEQDLCELRKWKIGVVFQNFYLLPHRTSLENVMFRFRYTDVPREDARRRSERTLSVLGLSGVARQPVRLLSGGEMQRVAIARATAVDPTLLLADEPTGNLDAASALSVMESLKQLNDRGVTVVLVTHNASLLIFCRRHLVCRDGSLQEGNAVLSTSA